jgi:DNA helicase IV
MEKNQSNEVKEIKKEQDYTDILYSNLDELRKEVSLKLHDERAKGGKGTLQSRSERDAFSTMYEERLSQLLAVEERLLFGKLIMNNGDVNYIGRIGLMDKNKKQLLMDWRAKASTNFYRATPASPAGVSLRRHIATDNRKVQSIEDEILDQESSIAKEKMEKSELIGEATFIKNLTSARTGKMTDIVTSIQAEQDKIIRSDIDNTLVVQGGPGTGKTAVALHRAAYLLYTNREVFQKTGVMIVGPNLSFLKYIDQVLPSLGESGVFSTVIERILPNITAQRKEKNKKTAALKSDFRIIEVIKCAIEDRIFIPTEDQIFDFDGNNITVYAEEVKKLIEQLKRKKLPHNEARKIFSETMITILANQVSDQRKHFVDNQERKIIMMDLRSMKEVRVLLNIYWMPMYSERLIGELWAKPHRLERAAEGIFTKEEQKELYVPILTPWTREDIPLLDEARHLLGNIEQDDEDYGDIGIDEYNINSVNDSSDSFYSGILNSSILKQREKLLNSIDEEDDPNRPEEYGHIIVDEAQELSKMEWRMLKRRCPSNSFTIVGDISQTSSQNGTFDWNEVIPEMFDKWKLEKLTINYRNPSSVAQKSIDFGKQNGLIIDQRISVRDEKDAYQTIKVNKKELLNKTLDKTIEFMKEFVGKDGTGRISIIIKDEQKYEFSDALHARIRQEFGDDELFRLDAQDESDSQVLIATPDELKGLEFDAVLFVEPLDYLLEKTKEDESSKNSNKLSKQYLATAAQVYVAITRSTRKLIILYTDKLPKGL